MAQVTGKSPKRASLPGKLKKTNSIADMAVSRVLGRLAPKEVGLDAEPFLTSLIAADSGEHFALSQDTPVDYSSAADRSSLERLDSNFSKPHAALTQSLPSTSSRNGDSSAGEKDEFFKSPASPSGLARVPAQEQKSTKVYFYRWVVLLVVCLVIAEEACIWNTWGPIADVAKVAFNWSDGSIALLANWGCVGYTVAALPLSWVMGRKGIRPVFIFAAVVCTLCCALRCISLEPTTASLLINVGHFFNGLSTPVALAAGPLVSAKWFPPSERVTATAIASMSTLAGLATSYLIGPFLVPDPMCDKLLTNATNTTGMYDNCVDGIRSNIRTLMFAELGFSGLVLICAVVLLRNTPKLPPSTTSSVPRLEFVAGLKQLVKNSRYLTVSMMYGLMNGVFSGWGAVLSLILSSYGISQRDAGLVGFSSTVAGMFSSILAARVADKLARRHKLLVMILLAGSFVAFLSLTLVGRISMEHGGYFTGLLAVVYLMVILGCMAQYGIIPVILELAVELSYPVAEGVTAVVTTFFSCLCTVIFLALLYVPSIGVHWMNWALVACSALCCMVMCAVRPQYKRLNEDLAAVP